MSTRRTRATRPLTTFQVNVGRGATAHELALSYAFTEKMDVVLIQEPYLFRDLQRKISKHHPSYECFSPVDNWSDAQPRVLTYIRKGAGLRCEQLNPLISTPEASRDLLFLHIAHPAGPNLLIVNVYNAPRGCAGGGRAAETLALLPRSLFDRPALVAGDFNLHHARWQPSLPGRSSSEAESFLDWADGVHLELISESDNPTHDRGNVLDLAFTSSGIALQGASASVATHLDVTSDHRPLVSSIPWDSRFQEPVRRFRLDTLNQSLFLSLLTSYLSRAPLLTVTPSREALDNFAADIVSALKSALEGSTKRYSGHSTGHAWWNDECAEAAQVYRTTRRNNPSDGSLGPAQRALRNSVRRAKLAYWRKQLDEASTSKDIFRMTKWHKSSGSFRSPPLKDPRFPNAPPSSSLADKRNILAENLLRNTAEVGDIPMSAPAVSQSSLPFPELTEEEIEKCILGAPRSTPGADEIPTSVLRMAWPKIKSSVLLLFRSCLAVGHHPLAFRNAVLVMVQKPKKLDKSCPRSYRPIALLSVLGKGLERVLARRMAWIAVQHKVLASQQFGALPLRSAVDLTTCLTHDIEEALNNNLTASVLTLDVKGAFDGVLPGRLARRLREQGWPDNLVRWVSSFATGRLVQIRLDGDVGPCTEVQCGLPQGSPISPILFMLYIAPILQMGRRKMRFGYADDIALLATSSSLDSNCQLLSEDLAEAVAWGESEGVTFDPGKSELFHFSRRRAD